MSNSDLAIHNSRNAARPATGPAPSNRRTGRVRWASATVGVAALAFLPVMAGCSGDDDPADPASSVPPVETGLTPAEGVVVPLEPGSNLPPAEGEGGGDGDEENDMDVDGDGIGESDGQDDDGG